MSALTAAERELGFVEYHCDAHGFLAATSPRVSVFCRCGKIARRLRNGRLVDPDTLRPTPAKARELNEAGHPRLHSCGDCGADFGGKTALRQHRVGRGAKKRCQTADEMTSRGWRQSKAGRWGRPYTPSIPERPPAAQEATKPMTATSSKE